MGREKEARERLARLGFNRVPPGVMDLSQLGKDQVVKDNYGRELHEGDVVVAPQAGATWRVGSVKPYPPTPGIPPNLLEVTLIAVVTFGVPRGASMEGVMRVITTKELAEMNGQQPPPQDPPADPPGDNEPADPPQEPPPGDPPSEEPPARPKLVITDDIIDPRD